MWFEYLWLAFCVGFAVSMYILIIHKAKEQRKTRHTKTESAASILESTVIFPPPRSS